MNRAAFLRLFGIVLHEVTDEDVGVDSGHRRSARLRIAVCISSSETLGGAGARSPFSSRVHRRGHQNHLAIRFNDKLDPVARLEFQMPPDLTGYRRLPFARDRGSRNFLTVPLLPYIDTLHLKSSPRPARGLWRGTSFRNGALGNAMTRTILICPNVCLFQASDVMIAGKCHRGHTAAEQSPWLRHTGPLRCDKSRVYRPARAAQGPAPQAHHESGISANRRKPAGANRG